MNSGMTMRDIRIQYERNFIYDMVDRRSVIGEVLYDRVIDYRFPFGRDEGSEDSLSFEHVSLLVLLYKLIHEQDILTRSGINTIGDM